MRQCKCKLVTSARFAKRNGRRREGDRDEGQPMKRSKPRVGHGDFRFKAVFSTKKTILQPRRQVRAAGALRGENRVHNGQGRTRGRGDYGACAA